MSELAKPRLLTIVVNPRSGGGRAGRALPFVWQHLREALATTEVRVIQSTSWEHASDQLRIAAMGARPGDSVVAMGGDGMVHLGLNACPHTDATLGIIPAGTGNDFAGALGIPSDVKEAVALIIGGSTRRVDLARVSNAEGTRYVGAIVSSGYDARVNRATNDTYLRLGSLSYGFIALRELASFRPMHYRLEIDGVQRELDAMLVAVANTSMIGGGMKMAPDADPADGLFDLTIIHPVSRGKMLRLMPTLYSGKFVRESAVERVRARSVRIDGDDMFLMGDGEEIGSVPATIDIDEAALRVYAP